MWQLVSEVLYLTLEKKSILVVFCGNLQLICFAYFELKITKEVGERATIRTYILEEPG
jgi:hypothetical protein